MLRRRQTLNAHKGTAKTLTFTMVKVLYESLGPTSNNCLGFGLSDTWVVCIAVGILPVLNGLC